MKRAVLIIFLIVLLIVSCNKFLNYRKQKFLAQTIQTVEDHKAKYGRYPRELPKDITENARWLYNYSDSTGQYFYLKYSSGIMGANQWKYESTSKKWEESFNY